MYAVVLYDELYYAVRFHSSFAPARFCLLVDIQAADEASVRAKGVSVFIRDIELRVSWLRVR